VLARIRQAVAASACEQLHDKIPTPDFVSFSAVGSREARSMLSRWQIAAWLSGYSHAKSNNLIIDLESFEENVNKLTNYCYDEKNFKVPIMEAIVRVVGK
jgi:HdeA/HdeB family